MRLRDKTALKKIVSEIILAKEFVADISLENFMGNEIIKRAVSMTVINIGELVKNLSAEFRAETSQVPWKNIAGFRDIAAHKYETLNMSQVYQTVKEDFPALKIQIEQILAAEE